MLIATLFLSLLTSLFLSTHPTNNDDQYFGRINLVSLFDNDTIGLEVSEVSRASESSKSQATGISDTAGSIYYLESILDKPPSYYLTGWFPHQARVMKINLGGQFSGNLVAYPIFESSVGPLRSQSEARGAGPLQRSSQSEARGAGPVDNNYSVSHQPDVGSINHRYIPSEQVVCLNHSRALNNSEYENLMFQIYQPQYFSTINFIGFSTNNWAESLFKLEIGVNSGVSKTGAFITNFVGPIISLCAMLIDACFYYLPKGLIDLTGFVYQHLSCLGQSFFLWAGCLIGTGSYLMVRNFQLIFNWNMCYYATGFAVLSVIYYLVLSVCFD